MKKLFVLIIGACFAIPVAGQNQNSDDSPKFHFGVKVAPGLSWLKSDKNSADNTPESDGSLLRASYGFIGDIRFSKNYFFSTGVNINYQGGKLSRQINYDLGGNPDSSRQESWKQDLRLRYIEIPLSIRLQTNRIGYIKYYFQAGVAPGFNIKARYDATETIDYPDQPSRNRDEVEFSEEDVNKDINFFNLSMLIGAGISYNLSGTTDLLLGLTFHNGFIDVTGKDAENPVLEKSNINSNLLSLDIGVLF